MIRLAGACSKLRLSTNCEILKEDVETAYELLRTSMIG